MINWDAGRIGFMYVTDTEAMYYYRKGAAHYSFHVRDNQISIGTDTRDTFNWVFPLHVSEKERKEKTPINLVRNYILENL